ncbi:MAG TPA: hypothetical protein VM370_07040 [Candidatus Thermoplasmatota archaeon]|nr:hypothetical protein [Candidatus Thermoplasmatota archaeon]
MRALLLALVLLSIPLVAAKGETLTLETPIAEKWSKPQSVVAFPVKVTSHVGHPITVTFEVVKATGGLVASQPKPFQLVGSNETTLAVQTPYHNGRVDESGTVTYRATPSEGAAQDLRVTVHTKGVYVPGPQLFGALVALALAARLARRGPR